VIRTLTLLARLDPGGPTLALAATAAAIVAVAALMAEAMARSSGRLGLGASGRHDLYLAALLTILLSPAIALGVGRSGLVLVGLPTPRVRAPEVGPPLSPAPGPEIQPKPPIDRPDFVARPAVPGDDEAATPAGPPGPVVVRVPSPVRTTPGPQVPVEPSGPVGGGAIVGGLAAAWVVGLLFLGSRLAHGALALIALRRRARPVEVGSIGGVLGEVRAAIGRDRLPPILEAGGLAGPMAGGVLRPVVVLPAGMAATLGPSGLRDVLIHECAHVARLDPLVGLLQRAAAAVFWPHPLVHRLNRRLSRAREEACDDLVLGAGDAPGYARTLLILAERAGASGRGGAVVGLFDSRWKLEDRVAGILERGGRPMTTKASRWTKVAAVAVLMAASVAVAAVRPEGGATGSESPTPPAVVAEPPAQDGLATVIEGTVVDEAGAPVGGAAVNVTWFRKAAEDAKTGPDGRFSLRIAGPIRPSELVRATADGEARIGIAEYHEPARSRPEPVRVVLKPARAVVVRVVDADGRPVPGAAVEVTGSGHGPIGRSETDRAGLARLLLPADAEVDHVAALKDGVGFDYFENYRSWPSRLRDPLPAEVRLVLDGALPASVRAVDPSGKPVPGVEFHPDLLQKPGKLSYFNGSGSDILVATTDAAGLARFPWLPKRLEMPVSVEARPWDYSGETRPTFKPGGEDVPSLVLRRNVRLSGKVTNLDGGLAEGVLIQAESRGKSSFYGRRLARTGPDGTYSVTMPADQMSMIAVVSPDHAAAPIAGIVPREGQPRDGLDLRLVAGTRFRATITTEAGGKPVPGAQLTIIALGAEVPEEFRGPNSTNDRLDLVTWAQADPEGRIDCRLGPGDYTILGEENLHVDGTGEVVREYHRKPTAGEKPAIVRGRVFDATGAANRPVAGARVRFWPPAGQGWRDILSVTDAAGRFELEPRGDKLGLFYARDQDGTIAGFLAGPAAGQEVAITLAPAATTSGRIVDTEGRPLAGRRVQLMTTVPRSLAIATPGQVYESTTTDPAGRYAFAGLVPDTEAEVSLNYEDATQPNRAVVEKLSVRGGNVINIPDIAISGGRKPAGPRADSGPAFAAGDVVGARPMPYLISGAEVEALVRAIGRDPATPALVEGVGVLVRPESRWVTDLGRIGQLATDPGFALRADRASAAVSGKPADARTLIDLAMGYTIGDDDATLRQNLRASAQKQPARPIRGTVEDAATGRPVPDAFVFGEAEATRTDALGSFRLADRGSRMAWVEAEGYALAEVVAPADPARPAKVALLREAPILGRVVDREGKPVEGAVIWAMVGHLVFVPGAALSKNDSYGFPITARTDARGRFAFRGMPPGAELDWIEVRHPSYRLARGEGLVLTAARPTAILVEPGCVVSGEVVDESGRPVAGASVGVGDRRRAGGESVVFTGPDGRYRVANVAPGRCDLVVQPEAHAPKIVATVADPARPAIHQVVVEPGGSIGGKVVDAEARPVAGAPVGWITPVDPSGVPQRAYDSPFHRMTYTADDGTFRLDSLPPGEFQITVMRPAGGARAEVVVKTNRRDLVVKLGP